MKAVCIKEISKFKKFRIYQYEKSINLGFWFVAWKPNAELKEFPNGSHLYENEFEERFMPIKK